MKPCKEKASKGKKTLAKQTTNILADSKLE